MKVNIYFAAEGFNCDAYGEHAFGECGIESGSLSPTGDIFILPLALAGAILIASGTLFIKRLRRSKTTKMNS